MSRLHCHDTGYYSRSTNVILGKVHLGACVSLSHTILYKILDTTNVILGKVHLGPPVVICVTNHSSGTKQGVCNGADGYLYT